LVYIWIMATQLYLPDVKAVVFDFDGTLADSFPVFVHAIAYALQRKPFTPEEVTYLRQHSVREVVKILKRKVDRHQDDITVFKDITDVLRQLSRQGYKARCLYLGTLNFVLVGCPAFFMD
jgi:phosphoglycolate phosphatase-like HAD superfamily hydrolase